MNSQTKNDLDQVNKEIKQLEDEQQKLFGKDLVKTIISMEKLKERRERLSL